MGREKKFQFAVLPQTPGQEFMSILYPQDHSSPTKSAAHLLPLTHCCYLWRAHSPLPPKASHLLITLLSHMVFKGCDSFKYLMRMGRVTEVDDVISACFQQAESGLMRFACTEGWRVCGWQTEGESATPPSTALVASCTVYFLAGPTWLRTPKRHPSRA